MYMVNHAPIFCSKCHLHFPPSPFKKLPLNRIHSWLLIGFVLHRNLLIHVSSKFVSETTCCTRDVAEYAPVVCPVFMARYTFINGTLYSFFSRAVTLGHYQLESTLSNEKSSLLLQIIRNFVLILWELSLYDQIIISSNSCCGIDAPVDPSIRVIPAPNIGMLMSFPAYYLSSSTHNLDKHARYSSRDYSVAPPHHNNQLLFLLICNESIIMLGCSFLIPYLRSYQPFPC